MDGPLVYGLMLEVLSLSSKQDFSSMMSCMNLSINLEHVLCTHWSILRASRYARGDGQNPVCQTKVHRPSLYAWCGASVYATAQCMHKCSSDGCPTQACPVSKYASCGCIGLHEGVIYAKMMVHRIHRTAPLSRMRHDACIELRMV